MKVLMIKLSSMGDILHTLAAVTELSKMQSIQIDWVVESAFAEIPAWHPAISRVFTIDLRAWRKSRYRLAGLRVIWNQIRQIRATRYDMIIDAQGLFKSALLSRLLHGKCIGFDAASAREGRLASFFYHQAFTVATNQHAVFRTKQLFAKAGSYLCSTEVDYGLARIKPSNTTPVFVFAIGASWANKQWPDEHWRTLIESVVAKGAIVQLTAGNTTEMKRAMALSHNIERCQVIKPGPLTTIRVVIESADALVASDTGLLHMAAALNCPAIGLYGPTMVQRSRPIGRHCQTLSSALACAPCMQRHCLIEPKPTTRWPQCLEGITPKAVLKALEKIETGDTKYDRL